MRWSESLGSMKRPETMKAGLNKRSFWSKSFVLFCLAGRVRYDPAVTQA